MTKQRKENGEEKVYVTIIEASDIPTGEQSKETKENGLPFMVVRSFENGLPLKENQILKFGKS